MVQLYFGRRAFSRSGGLPESRFINMYGEDAPLGITPNVCMPRPGLVSAYSLGAGPIRGLFRKSGVLDGSLFIVSGTALYKSDGTNLGAIPGTDLVRIDASASQMVLVAGGLAYVYDGATLTQITDTDLPTVSDVVYFGSRFVFTQQGSGRFYWSNINDATNIDGLAFSNSEASPDANLGLAIVGDQLAFHGGDSIEFWTQTADPANPYQKNDGQRYMHGCASRDTIALLDNTLFFVGVDDTGGRFVYRTRGVAERISDHGIEDKLRQCATISAATAVAVSVDGHGFYVLNLPGVGSYAFDVASKAWAEWQSYGQTTFRCAVAASVDGTAYVGDQINATVWSLSPSVRLDGADPITFVASCFHATISGFERCDRLSLQCVRGVGLATGQGSDPLVEMRYSNDVGRTWCDWRQATLGKVGEYSKRAYWQRLGPMKAPGRMFEFRSTDPVNAIFESVYLNEARV